MRHGEGPSRSRGLERDGSVPGRRSARISARRSPVVAIRNHRVEPVGVVAAVIEEGDELVGGQWITVAGRSHGHGSWSIRGSAGTWSTWVTADRAADHTAASLWVSIIDGIRRLLADEHGVVFVRETHVSRPEYFR